MQPGPLKERLRAVEQRLSDGVRETWSIARQGDNLIDALRQIDVDEARRELAELERDERHRGDSLDGARKAVEAELASAQRIDAVARDAVDRLRVLTAQLDEAVARAVELSVRSTDTGDLGVLSADVEHLVDDLEALRQGMEEAGGRPLPRQ